MTGWIKLHRKLINWEWYSDTNTFRLFVHCLLRANHSDSTWRGHALKRGQFLTSLPSISKETGLSISQIRTSISNLESTGEIADLSQSRGRVVTVLNYDSYQESSRLDGSLVAGSSQDDRRMIAADKNVKNVKNDKNVKNTPSSISSNDQNSDECFEAFWRSGIKKANKKKTQSLFGKLLAKHPDPWQFTNKLVSDVQARLSVDQLGFRSMLPTTYLNNERWEDEISKGEVRESYQTTYRKISLAEETERATDEAFADIAAREAAAGSVAAYDGPLRAEVDITHGSNENARRAWESVEGVFEDFSPMVQKNEGFDR